MRKSIFYIITALGLLSLNSCEKDETKAVLSSNPVAPTLSVPASLSTDFTRANGASSIKFMGKAADLGFKASIKYTLEADTSAKFVKPVSIASAYVDTFSMTISDLNTLLLKQFTADSAQTIHFRVKTYVTDAVPTVYSAVSDVKLTPYGLPRLDLISGTTVTGKVESSLGNGSYTGLVYVDATKPFTLKDPDTGIVYGNSGGALSTTGSAISAATGWYRLTANTKSLTYTLDPHMVGLVGAFDGWSSPDSKMAYNAKTGTWSITIALPAGEVKFRMNDDWAWNLGGTPDNLTHGGSNITLAAGTYTITLTITNDVAGSETGTYTIVSAK